MHAERHGCRSVMHAERHGCEAPCMRPPRATALPPSAIAKKGAAHTATAPPPSGRPHRPASVRSPSPPRRHPVALTAPPPSGRAKRSPSARQAQRYAAWGLSRAPSRQPSRQPSRISVRLCEGHRSEEGPEGHAEGPTRPQACDWLPIVWTAVARVCAAVRVWSMRAREKFGESQDARQERAKKLPYCVQSVHGAVQLQ